MHEVLIHSPYPRQKSQGNAVTALRMKKLMTERGLDVAIHERGDAAMDARCLIALNARKSAAEIFDFHQRQPESAIVALLTGTDVNHVEMEEEGSNTRRALDLSQSIVSLHEGFSHRIPKHLSGKTKVIYPSVKLPDFVKHSPSEHWEVVIAGNFRDEKNPHLLIQTVRDLEHTPVIFHAYGDGGGYLKELEKTVKECKNFHFHGVQDHEVLLARMQRASILLNTSIEEGGANAICEAVVIGLPVIASKIDGNVGMLGGDYPGFFCSNDRTDLNKVLLRTCGEKGFYQELKQLITTRKPLFCYQREAEQWVELVRHLLK